MTLVHYLNIPHLIRDSSYPILLTFSSKYVDLTNCFKTSHPIIISQSLQRVCELASIIYLKTSFLIIAISSKSRQYVNLDICLNAPYLIVQSHLLFSVSAWTGSIDLTPLIWSHPLHPYARPYVNLISIFTKSHPIILPHPLHLSSGCSWICSVVWIQLIWPSYPSSSSLFRKYVNLFSCLNTHLIFLCHPLHVPSASTWTLVICLNTVHLIILSHPFHPSSGCSWTLSIVWIPLIWPSDQCSSSVFSEYAKLVTYLNTRQLIILFIHQDVRQLSQSSE